MLDDSPLANHTHDRGDLRATPGGVEWRAAQETLRVEAWGIDGIRVRSRLAGPILDDVPGALLDPTPTRPSVSVDAAGGGATVVNGALRVEVSATGRLRFLRADDGTELLAEQDAHFWWPGPRLRTPHGNGYHRIEQRFRAYPEERLYGLGQHQHGLFDQKGAVIDLVQRNGEVSIPFALSNRGYGLLWNSPAIGRVEFAGNGTRWVADSARQLDYWITAGTPADILRRYADATGHTPPLPGWAAGFWQCKLRYRTQEELLTVAREYHRRGVQLSVIVCDFFHWTQLGDWRFDPAEWPDPAGAVKELASYGIRLMVSVWPSVSPLSENHAEMSRRGLFIGTEFGPTAHADWPDKGVDTPVQVAFYDATNPEARAYLWDRLAENYLSLGVESWWADACEPELRPGYPANLRYHAGPGLEVGNLYPRENSRALYEGMVSTGRADVLTLNRSAWAGSQRYGAAVWSGDIGTDFETLRHQVAAGLNMAVSGIPWWTTDIGGFHGGDPDSPAYREVLTRWFQFGTFCPLMRLHGFRDPAMSLGPEMTGGPNEIWSYGPEAYQIMVDHIRLRERLTPYLLHQTDLAHREGLPVMRPLFVDFPDDPTSWTVDDAFLFGADLLVAPVLEAGARTRSVYLPAAARWRDAWSGQEYPGGSRVTVEAPLERIPLFLRDDAVLPIHEPE
jgi:alpha-D-xyloside xylohydrolase